MQINGSCIYLIAGEVSGDAIGAKLMRKISEILPQVRFSGVGGEAMKIEGLTSLFQYDQINLMGFVEILPHIFHLRKLIQQTANDIIAKSPDILVTIDSPGFTYRVAKLVRESCPNMKMVHVVAPSVWAYKPGRAAKYAAIYNRMLTLLPFEPPYFEAVGLRATCIGHPIFEQNFGGGEAFRQRHGIAADTKMLVITPGSRKGEITRHLPAFMDSIALVRKQYPEMVTVFALSGHKDLVSRLIGSDDIIIGSHERLEAYAAADAALAKSGTNTLEIAASLTPMIVAYKLNFFTFWAVKLMAKIKYASLINIIAGKEVIPEFLQHECTPQNLATGLLQILSSADVGREQVLESTKSLKAMGFGSKNSPTDLAAKIIVEECL